MLHTKRFLSNFWEGIETAQYLLAVPVLCLHREQLEKQLNTCREIVIHKPLLELVVFVCFEAEERLGQKSHISGFCFLFKAGM